MTESGRKLTISCSFCPNVLHFEGDFEITDALAMAEDHTAKAHPQEAPE